MRRLFWCSVGVAVAAAGSVYLASKSVEQSPALLEGLADEEGRRLLDRLRRQVDAAGGGDRHAHAAPEQSPHRFSLRWDERVRSPGTRRSARCPALRVERAGL